MAGIIAKKQAEVAAAKTAPTIQDYIRKMSSEIEKALPSVITPERFTRITLSALSTNPMLQQCSPKSFLGAMMTSAQGRVSGGTKASLPHRSLHRFLVVPNTQKPRLQV